MAENVELKKEHGALGVRYHVSGLMDFDVEVNVPGSFSVYNSLTAIAICHHFGVDEEKIKHALFHVSVKSNRDRPGNKALHDHDRLRAQCDVS